MSWLARYLARSLWWGMLWLMRRPWMKRLQRMSFNLVPESRRAKAWEKHRRQNAFALKYGLTMVTIAVNLFLASVLVTAAYMFALSLYDSGALSGPGTREP